MRDRRARGRLRPPWLIFDFFIFRDGRQTTTLPVIPTYRELPIADKPDSLRATWLSELVRAGRCLLGSAPMVLGFRPFRLSFFRFESFVLLLQRSILLGQGLDLIPQIAIVFHEFRHMRLQLFVLLPCFCIFAGNQRQTQCRREEQTSNGVLAHSLP